jgi:hypothetical protein
MPPSDATPASLPAQETYCGPISWLIGIFLFPCICFCPVDERCACVRVSRVVDANRQPSLRVRNSPCLCTVE